MGSDQAMAQAPELLPCPFCGAAASIYDADEPPVGKSWFVRCDPCDLIHDKAWCVPRDEAIAEWNTRSHAIHEPASVMREEAAKVAGGDLETWGMAQKTCQRVLSETIFTDEVSDDQRKGFRSGVEFCIGAIYLESKALARNLPLPDGVREGSGPTPPLTNGA